MKNKIQIFVSLILLVIAFPVHAQDDIRKEVRVVKPYTPTLTDASKINLLPLFNDTSKVYRSFEYEITPKQFSTNFRVKPIKPAKMLGLPLKRLYKSHISLGIDNYISPYVELSVNQLRDRKSAIGFYFRHHSSGGKVRLENDEKVDAGFSDNLINLYGRKMYKRSVLEAKVYGAYNSLLYYGYDPDLTVDLDKDDIRQKIYNVGTTLKYYSSNPDSSHINYKVGLKYDFLSDAYETREQSINIDGGVAKFIGDFYSGVDFGLQMYNRNEELDSTNNAIVNVNPSISKTNGDWKFILGLDFSYDHKGDEGNLFVYPKANFEFNIVKNVLIPYMGITGHREVNSYGRILRENPFTSPGTIVENANHAMIGFFGLKGRYSSKMAFDLQLKYSKVDSMHFFTNSNSDSLMNKFGVEYDDGSVLNVGAEISYNHSEKLNFVLRTDYYKYNLDDLEFAWHKPGFKASLNTSYNLRDKILIDGDIFFTGKRNVMFYGTTRRPGMVKELKPYIDANISAEYRYTPMLSFFVKVNNLTASKYNEWYLYPVQRFQFMAGFTYAL